MREIYIFGVRFLDGTVAELFAEMDKGGVLVAPAAPALSCIKDDPSYHDAIKNSNVAIFDSGLLCVVMLLIKKIKVRKVSGLEFMREFLKRIKEFEKNTVFLINPSVSEGEANKKLLNNCEYKLENIYQYVAPFYDISSTKDEVLLGKLNILRPKYIVINLGGGVQEKLALYLKNNIKSYCPSIICTGAAISFITGMQARIPIIIDKLYLGWLYRCIDDYKKFVPRYVKAFKIIPMLLDEKIIINQFANSSSKRNALE